MQLIGTEDEGAIVDSPSVKDAFGRNFMACIFGARKAGKHPEHPESVGPLALRRRFCSPLDCRTGSYVRFTSLLRKRSEIVKQVLVHLHTKTCGPPEIKISMDQSGQHGNTSGHGRAISRRRFTSTFA